MVSYADLDPNAPFATVFTVKGMEWAAKIVAIGALFGEPIRENTTSDMQRKLTRNGMPVWPSGE